MDASKFLELSRYLICTTDFESNFQFANAHFYEVLGYSSTEVIGKNFKDFVHPEDIVRADSAFKSLLKGSDINDLEIRYLNKDQSEIYISWKAFIVEEERSIYIFGHDISKLKHAEAEIVKKNILLDQTSKMAKIGGWELDLETMTGILSEETYRIYGISDLNEVLSIEEGINFYAPEAQPIILKAVDDAIKKGIPYDLELPFTTKQGKNIWIRTQGKTIRENGKAIRLIGTIQDITERKKEENISHRTKQLLEASQSIAKVGGWELDLVTNELFWTAETYRIHETSPATFDPTVDAGLHFYLPESQQLLSDALERAMSNGEGYDLELELKTKKGRHIHVRTTCTATRENEKTVKLTGAIQDITEQKLFEKELLLAKEKVESNEEHLLNIINSIGDPFFVKDEQSRLLQVNDAFCDLFGMSTSDVIGKTLAEHVPPDEREHFLRIDHQVIATGEESIVEESLTLSEGVTKTISTKKSRFVDSDGNKFLVGIIRDLTERKALENQLYKNTQLLEASQSIAKIGGWELDLVTNELFWTAETYHIHDTTPEEFVPTTIDSGLAFYLPESRKVLADAAKISMESGDGFDVEVQLKTAKNRVIEVRTTGKLHFEEGKPIKLLGAIQDITERKLYEQKIKENEANISAILNSLPSSVCVIDDTGKILQVNEAWNEFATKGGQNRPVEQYADYNYLDVCKADFADEYAKTICHGLQRLLVGEIEEFEHEYPCHTPDKQQWFLMRANFMKTTKRQIVIAHIDITERKQWENDQREVMQQMQLAIKTAKLGVWSLDMVSGLLEWNDQLLEIYGLSREEWKADLDGWRNQLHPEDADYANEQFAQIFNGESVFGVEFRIIRKDGEIRYINASGAPVIDEKKQIIQVIGINRDVTSEKITEKELKLSETKFSSAFENTPIPTSILNLKTGERIAINEAFCKTFGYSRSELLDGDILLISLAADQEEFKEALNMILLAKELNGYPIEMKTKSGEIKFMHVHGRKLYPENDDIFIGSFLDVTEIHKAEQDLKQSESNLLRAQQIAQLGSWYLDLATNHVKWSEELFKMFGMEPGKPAPAWHEQKPYYTEESWELLTSAVDKTAKEGVPYVLELNIIRKDKSIGWISSRGEALKNEHGEIYALSGVAHDITSSKENLFQLEAAKKKAEEADQLKSTFLSNMSHEIRTPLNAIIGFSRLLGDGQEEDMEMYVHQIQNNSKQLLTLVDDILNISRIEGGGLQLHYKPVQLHLWMQKVFEQHKTHIDNHHKDQNIQLVLRVPKTEPEDDRIEVDEVRLKEILHNLIYNAIKFTKNGNIEIGYEYQPNEVVFFVKDEGIGIPEDQHERIFERFGQVDGTSDEYGGTGLGLAICEGLVEKMGGKIWVESKLNVGSTFWFTIPSVASTPNQYYTPKKTNTVNSGKPAKTVLIADDSKSVLLFYKTIMKKYNVDAFLAKNGEGAIETYQQNMDKIDLVLIDIRMPGIGGIEAMKQIKKINPDVPVIAQTAFALEGELERFLKEGFDDCLTKPIPEDELAALLKGGYIRKNE